MPINEKDQIVTSLKVDPDLWKQAKIAAIECDITLGEAHRPSIKRMDSKTGEMQKMMPTYSKETQEISKKYFDKEIVITTNVLDLIEKHFFNGAKPTNEIKATVVPFKLSILCNVRSL